MYKTRSALKIIIISMLITCIGIFIDISPVNAAGNIRIDNEHFSADMIRLLKHGNVHTGKIDINNDGILSQSEINKTKVLVYSAYEFKKRKKIDFRGIEYLTCLEKIELERIEIKNFNIYKLPKLKSVSLMHNCKMKKGSLLCDKLKSIEKLVISNSDVKYKGDFHCNTRLKTLSIYDANIKRVAVAKLKELEEFTYYGEMAEINLKNNKKLKKVYIKAPIEKINFKKNKALKEIGFSSDVCSVIEVSGAEKLELLEIEAPITDLNVSGNRKLRSLTVLKANLTAINLASNEKLKNCNIDSPLESIDVSKLKKLKRLELSNIKTDNLIIDNEQIKVMALNDSDISILDLSLLPDIRSLDIARTRINSIVFSENNQNFKKITGDEGVFLGELQLGDAVKLNKVTIYENETQESGKEYNISELMTDVNKTVAFPKQSVWEIYVE